MEFGVKIPQGFDVQSARGALRELLGGNGKLRRSGREVITTIMVNNHEIEFEPWDLRGGRQTLPSCQIWRRCTTINLQVLQTS
jgi:hypothetical protein